MTRKKNNNHSADRFPARSPESMRCEQFAILMGALGQSGLAYVRHLYATNGSTEPHDDGPDIVWGLRSEASGRWIHLNDKYGVDSLLIIRTQSLARASGAGLGLVHSSTAEEDAEMSRNGLRVVWMTVSEFFRKVRDSVETGYPTQVLLFAGIDERGHTIECVWSCQDMVAVELQGFESSLAGIWREGELGARAAHSDTSTISCVDEAARKPTEK